ncbi:hypothetical protein Tco_0004764 [Tanacetum coccineum]
MKQKDLNAKEEFFKRWKILKISEDFLKKIKTQKIILYVRKILFVLIFCNLFNEVLLALELLLLAMINAATRPNKTDMNDLESDDESVDTPLVSPFPHSDNDSDDGEVLNELIEYENVGMLRRERAINSFDEDDLAFQLRGDGVAGIKRHRRDLSSDGVRNFATVSGRGRLKEDLESSTWRRRQDF